MFYRNQTKNTPAETAMDSGTYGEIAAVLRNGRRTWLRTNLVWLHIQNCLECL